MKYQLLTGFVFLYSISLAQNTLPNSGNIGIGTTSPRAALDVAIDISNEKLGTIFGRLTEGDWEKTGTFLGVKGFETQFSGYGGKSFSIVHNFYGDTNSSINFYRGGDRTGGFMTFNTSQDIERLRISPNGNVGIGTRTPTNTLTLGSIAYGTSNDVGIDFSAENGNYSPVYARIALGIGTAAQNQGTGYLSFSTLNSGALIEGMRINPTGNIGIGTTSPREKLSVNGKIRAHEIKVEAANWPDYVFAKDYKLPTLQETENHIKEKGHLPGIPSVEEVKANGIDLGEMNAKLLQKIEELTLHLIEKDKQLSKQQSSIDQQECRLKKLENLLKL